MKHLMTAALALTLLGGTSALADPPESGHHPAQGAARPAPSAPRAPAPQAAPGGSRGPAGGGAPAYQGAPRGGPPGATGARQGPGGYPGYQGGAQTRQNGQAAPGGTHNSYPGYQGGTRGQGAAEGARGAERGGDRSARAVPNTYRPRFGAPGVRPGGPRPHYDAQYFPRVFRPDHQYGWLGSPWISQPGFYYRQWGYGERLPYGWYADRWIIDDYYDYDLAVPPYGYDWVRVGPDALLVDLDDGTVVESVYGLFY